MRTERGYTLLEITISLALASVVMGLIGSLFVVSFTAWQRGRDVREVQVQSAAIVDLVARDVRASSQAAGITLRPDLPVDSGIVLVAISRRLSDELEGGEDSPWILYVFDEQRQELHRLLAGLGAQGEVDVHTSRVVGLGVRRISIEDAEAGVAIEVEVRRGRAASRMRGAARPQNP